MFGDFSSISRILKDFPLTFQTINLIPHKFFINPLKFHNKNSSKNPPHKKSQISIKNKVHHNDKIPYNFSQNSLVYHLSVNYLNTLLLIMLYQSVIYKIHIKLTLLNQTLPTKL